MRSLCLILGCISLVLAHRKYQSYIPNGFYVPNPCFPGTNTMWSAVGHLGTGGGSKNPFGLDFAAHGHRWTKALCETDSDGDGLSNGAELGDPSCTLSFNIAPPARSHPGICDPPGSCAGETNICGTAGVGK